MTDRVNCTDQLLLPTARNVHFYKTTDVLKHFYVALGSFCCNDCVHGLVELLVQVQKCFGLVATNTSGVCFCHHKLVEIILGTQS